MPTVAHARYTGSARTHRRSCPSGSVYRFQNRPSPEVDDRVPVDSTEDAEYLASLPVVEVDWTASGKAQDAAEDAAASASSAVERMRDWGYNQKKSVASELRDRGVIPESFDLSQSEEALEAELGEHAELLADAMED